VVKIVTDKGFINSFIFDDPELVDRLTDDYTVDDVERVRKGDPLTSIWVGYFGDDGVCKAMASLDKETSTIMNMHINVPKQFRDGNTYSRVIDIVEFIEKNIDKQFIKLNAKIPSKYQDVIAFAKKFGFVQYGIDKGVHLKGGKLYDRVFMSKRIRRIHK